jgi:hypothetical protein
MSRETRHIIDMMKATGNRPGIVAQWKGAVADWAQKYRTEPDAAAVNAWLPLWQPGRSTPPKNWRPCGRRSLSQPASRTVGLAGLSAIKSARRGWRHELDFCGLPRLGHGYTKNISSWSAFIIGAQATKEEIEREIENAFG